MSHSTSIKGLVNGTFAHNAANDNGHTKETLKSNASSTSDMVIGDKIGLEWFEMELDYLRDIDVNSISESLESEGEVQTRNKGGRPKKNRLTKCPHCNKTTYTSSCRSNFRKHVRTCAEKHGGLSSLENTSD